MTTITIQEAQAKLSELIEQLAPGEEFLITDHGLPLAQVKKAERTSWPSKAGCYQKAEFQMAPDFDAPLDDFRARAIVAKDTFAVFVNGHRLVIELAFQIGLHDTALATYV